MKKILFALAITLTLASIASAQMRPRPRPPGGGDGGDLVDRLLKCEEEKRNIDSRYRTEIDSLRFQLYQCQNNPGNTMWSCTAGCRGSGNVGFGSGRTEAEARAASLRDLGLTCSHHTFDCRRE